MSTTAQEEKHLVDQSPPAAASETPAPAPTPAATEQAASNSREYTLFEEARQDTWAQVGKVEASSQEEALNTLGEQKLAQAQKENKRFMAIPSRFAVPRKPNVQTQTSISFD